jgi:DEAD/DEAH box helicase domain-containing protein
VPTVFLWESVPGGVGFGQHLYNETGRLLAVASGALGGCACTDGCPGCVGPPPAPGLGSKGLVARALDAMRAALPMSPATSEPPASPRVVTSAGDLAHAAG